jgi:hypothetical protein
MHAHATQLHGRFEWCPGDGIIRLACVPLSSGQAPSLIDKSQPYFSGIARFGIAGFWSLLNDPYHTLLVS